MIKIDVLSDERAWSKKIRKKKLFFNNLCKLFPKKYQYLNKEVSLTLLLSNNKGIKKLNKNFRNKNNILFFTNPRQFLDLFSPKDSTSRIMWITKRKHFSIF